MNHRQRLQIEQSTKRERVNVILATETDKMTEELRGELDTLTGRLQTIEPELRAAIAAEGDEEQRARGMFGPDDGEGAERNRLLTETSLTDYLNPASAGGAVEGRAKELNAALSVPVVGASGGVAVPWAMFGTEEVRAFTATANNDGPNMQRPILQRLFGPGVMDTLGVRMDSVPAGRAEWPLVSGGVAPAQAKEEAAAADAAAATFTFASLKPKRLSGKYEYTHEIAASVAELEQALRRDLADAIKSSMSNQIINGAAPTNANPQNVQGFIARLGAATDLSAAVVEAGDYGSLHANGVDGIHASMETEVMSVIGDETYQHAAGVYLAGSGEAGSELLRRRSGGCYASTYIPAVTATKQSAILHAAGPNGGGIMRGDSVAAVWPVLEIVRDIYSQASQGVVLTWVTLWDAHTAFRTAAYKHYAIKTS